MQPPASSASTITTILRWKIICTRTKSHRKCPPGVSEQHLACCVNLLYYNVWIMEIFKTLLKKKKWGSIQPLTGNLIRISGCIYTGTSKRLWDSFSVPFPKHHDPIHKSPGYNITNMMANIPVQYRTPHVLKVHVENHNLKLLRNTYYKQCNTFCGCPSNTCNLHISFAIYHYYHLPLMSLGFVSI